MCVEIDAVVYGDGGEVIKAEQVIRRRCKDCNETGMSHCSDPAHCGGMKMTVDVKPEMSRLRESAGALAEPIPTIVSGLLDVIDGLLNVFNATIEYRVAENNHAKQNTPFSESLMLAAQERLDVLLPKGCLD